LRWDQWGRVGCWWASCVAGRSCVRAQHHNEHAAHMGARKPCGGARESTYMAREEVRAGVRMSCARMFPHADCLQITALLCTRAS